MKRINEKILYAITLLVVLLGTGVFYFNRAEGWSYVDSFYFCVQTLTTIGFGDLTPTTDASKLFTSFYALFGIGVMLYVLGSIIGAYLFRQEKYFDRIFSILHRIRKRVRNINLKKNNIKKQSFSKIK